MKLAAISSTVIVALITGPYIFVEGFRASIPLLIALVLGIVWTVISE